MTKIVAPKDRLDWGKITAVSVIRNEEDIIGENLEHLRSYGISNFVISDNNSSDKTLALIREFALTNRAANVVILEDPVRCHTQSRKMTALSCVASGYFGTDWILPFDADDFFWLSPGPLIKLDGDIDFIRLPWLQAHPLEHPLNDIRRSWIERHSIAALTRTSHPKVVYRWKRNRYLADGSHSVHGSGPRPLRGVDGADLGMCFVHYPVRSAEQFRSKFIHGASALPTDEKSAGVGYHWRGVAQILRNHDDRDGLFNAFWKRDLAGFERICATHGIDPKALAYIYDMLIGTRFTFPDRQLKDVQHAARLWAFRPNANPRLSERMARSIAKRMGKLL